MNMLFYQSPFLKIEYQPENKLLITTWNVQDINFSDDDYKNEVLNYVRAVERYDVKAIIVDTRNYRFPLTPSLNQWTVENITPKLAANGVKRMAYVMPTDVLSKLGVELLASTAQTKGTIIRQMFDDYEQAYNWAIAANQN